MSGHDHHAHHNHDHNHGNTTTNVTEELTTMAMKVISTVLTTASPVIDHHQGHGHDHMDMGHDHGNMGHDHGNMGHDHGNMGMDMNHSDHMPGMHDMMKMYFHVGVNETILFQEWYVHTVGGMVGAVIGVMLLAFLYEGLKFLREQLYRQQYTRLSYSTCAVTGNSAQQGPVELHKITQTGILSIPHLIQTCLHMTQVLLSYFLMLVFMTFNVWLCIGILLGSGAGYFLFGWTKSTIVGISDHCH